MAAPDLILHRLASADCEINLKAIREVKNQIIGNRTKKLTYINLGVVPAITTILAQADTDSASGSNLCVQSAAALGSFACGLDAGVRAVVDAGAIPHLARFLRAADDKVVDAAARSLRMIYQSKVAPKYDFSKEENLEFLLSLLKSVNENLTGLGASIVIHSCETSDDQNRLRCAGALESLFSLLNGSASQRDSSLESLAAILKNNSEAVSKFVDLQSGTALSYVIELSKDRYSRTRLLACLCLISVNNSSSCYLLDIRVKTKLIYTLLKLIDDIDKVGDDVYFAFSSLVAENEDLQKLAFEAEAIDKLFIHLQDSALHPKRLEGIFLALAGLCSKLECCRAKFVSFQDLSILIRGLTHDDANVCTAACICLKSVSRSIKNLSTGCFMDKLIVIPLVKLLSDRSTSVQVAALGAISNIVVDFKPHKSIFMQCGGLKELVQLTKSMNSSLRLNAVRALRNMVFLMNKTCKEGVFMELTASSVASLIWDPEPSVQEQALALVRNFVDGCMDSVEYAFVDDGIILKAVGRLLQRSSKIEIGIQGMYMLSNIASGNESHKEAVMQLLFSQEENMSRSILSRFLQSNDSHLRTSSLWVLVNLTLASSAGAYGRIMKLRQAGIVAEIKKMVTDPSMDVKLRARQAFEQINVVRC